MYSTIAVPSLPMHLCLIRHPHPLPPVSSVYFVRICFSFPGEYKKLFAYALGTNFLS